MEERRGSPEIYGERPGPCSQSAAAAGPPSCRVLGDNQLRLPSSPTGPLSLPVCVAAKAGTAGGCASPCGTPIPDEGFPAQTGLP